MKYAKTVLDLVGNTPLVRLNRVTTNIRATVLVKLEYLNPGGSSKDRIATRIIDAAEEDGLLKPGGTIVEATSGNTGIGLALVAQQRGYRCIFVMPDKVGEDKRAVLTAYGAEIVVTPTAVTPEHPESYYSVSDRLAAEIPGAFKPNQYANMNGPRSHYETTGPEIWRDTEGRVSHFVAGIGTGGTISGTGAYLKEVSAARVQIIGADPEGSVFSGGSARPYLVEGVGEDFWPQAYDSSIVDQVITSSDAESFAMTRRLAREEGLLVGGSSGLAVSVALKAAESLPADAVVVVLLPDGGRGYLGKIFNQRWFDSHGFGEENLRPNVRELCGERKSAPSDLIHVQPNHTLRHVMSVMSAHGCSHLPVLSANPPVMMAEVLGSVHEKTVLDQLASGRVVLSDSVETVMQEPLPLVGITEPISVLQGVLGSVDAAMVTEHGKPVCVVGRRDLVSFFDRNHHKF